MKKYLIVLILIFLVGCGKKAPINTEVKLAVRDAPEVKVESEKVETKKVEKPKVETKPEAKAETKPKAKPVAKKAAPVSVNQPNNSILIGGHILPITNVNTQARIDSMRKEFVNWHSEVDAYKTVNNNIDYYLAVHVDSWGWLVNKYNSFVFKDINGNSRTYVKSRVSPVFSYYQPDGDHGGGPGSDYSGTFYFNQNGNAIGIQTCINSNGDYQIHTYHAQ